MSKNRPTLSLIAVTLIGLGSSAAFSDDRRGSLNPGFSGSFATPIRETSQADELPYTWNDGDYTDNAPVLKRCLSENAPRSNCFTVTDLRNFSRKYYEVKNQEVARVFGWGTFDRGAAAAIFFKSRKSLGSPVALLAATGVPVLNRAVRSLLPAAFRSGDADTIKGAERTATYLEALALSPEVLKKDFRRVLYPIDKILLVEAMRDHYLEQRYAEMLNARKNLSARPTNASAPVRGQREARSAN